LGRERVLGSGSYLAAQCTANQEPLAKFGSVLIAVVQSFGHIARHQLFN
jgi:hypothetical protein